MQVRKNYLAVMIGLLLLPFAMQAQQKANIAPLINKATKEYTSLRYVSTIQLLTQALKKDPDRSSCQRNDGQQL
ncbi:hypothetical protein [Pedobacter sp. UC225_65]|uniref:hypothetical protein n=1 Tax=Pedobacter sp. UC225_65 TaxID=3350173 RepID=UPI00366B7D6A